MNRYSEISLALTLCFLWLIADRLKELKNGNKELLGWVVVIAFWFIGDVTTTYVGMEIMGLTESNPAMRNILHSYGYDGMVFIKVILFAFMFGMTNLIPERKFRIAISYVVGFIGIVVVTNNIVAFYIVA